VARRTNLALLAALIAAFVTGVLALWVGEGRALIAAWAHGAAGFLVLLLVRWKLPVVRRGLRRHRPDAPSSVLTAIVAVAMLTTGLAHSLGLSTGGPITVLGLHIALALALVPLVAIHLTSRPARPRRGDLTRAGFLRLAGLALAAVGAKAAFEGTLAASRAPTGSLRREQPLPTSWMTDSTPSLDPAEWEGRLRGLPVRSVDCALDCTSGWYSVNRWAGVAVPDLLGTPPPGTRSLLVSSHTGYSRRFDVADASRLLLATTLDGAPLPAANGGPARLVAAGRRGFWWVKWVRAIEYSSRPPWWQLPFPI
jgi:Oxidoreductase molybdopterin binding domain